MVATKSNVNVKIDTVVKETATMLLDRMGIDQTTAIDMFYRQIIAIEDWAQAGLTKQSYSAHCFTRSSTTFNCSSRFTILTSIEKFMNFVVISALLILPVVIMPFA